MTVSRRLANLRNILNCHWKKSMEAITDNILCKQEGPQIIPGMQWAIQTAVTVYSTCKCYIRQYLIVLHPSDPTEIWAELFCKHFFFRPRKVKKLTQSFCFVLFCFQEWNTSPNELFAMNVEKNCQTFWCRHGPVSYVCSGRDTCATDMQSEVRWPIFKVLYLKLTKTNKQTKNICSNYCN